MTDAELWALASQVLVVIDEDACEWLCALAQAGVTYQEAMNLGMVS